ncbi:hypothetical protein L345_06247, partial [Ophiophagus hannah]
MTSGDSHLYDPGGTNKVLTQGRMRPAACLDLARSVSASKNKPKTRQKDKSFPFLHLSILEGTGKEKWKEEGQRKRRKDGERERKGGTLITFLPGRRMRKEIREEGGREEGRKEGRKVGRKFALALPLAFQIAEDGKPAEERMSFCACNAKHKEKNQPGLPPAPPQKPLLSWCILCDRFLRTHKKHIKKREREGSCR